MVSATTFLWRHGCEMTLDTMLAAAIVDGKIYVRTDDYLYAFGR